MDPRDLFVETVEDLRLRCDLRASEYDMVQVAGLVRRLLFDDTKLWAEGNRTLQVKVRYAWTGLSVVHEGGSIPMLWLDPVLQDLLLHRSGMSKQTPAEVRQLFQPMSGTVDAFLRYPIIQGAGGTVTTHELVSHYAVRRGGVHYDPRPSKNALLARLCEESDEALRLTLLAIGRIVHRALEPVAAGVLLEGRPHPYGLDATVTPPMEETR